VPRAARAFWVAAAALGAHATALWGGLIWLDHAHIEARYALAAPTAWLSLFRRAFAETGFYRPLMALSLSLDALAGGTLVFHATTLAWHALASVFVALAGEALGLTRRAATLGALAFAVHPLGSLPAGAIAFRSEAMIATFLLGLVVAHVRHRPLLAFACVLGGALTKETALVLAPLFVVALELGEGERRWKLMGAEALAFAGALGLRVAYAPAWHARFPELSASEALGTRFAAFTKSVVSFVLPLEPTACDAFPVTPITAFPSLFGLALVVGVGALAWCGGRAGLLLALSVLPSLQLVPTLRWWSPHYLYVALAFAALIVAARVEAKGKTAFTLLLLALVPLAVLSWRDGRRLRSDEAFWRPEVEREPACREGHFYLGEVYRAERRFREAAREYEAALAPHPGVLAFVDLGATLQNLGTARLELNQLDAARDAFTEALGLAQADAARRRLRHNLALIALRQQEPAEAERLLRSEAERPDGAPESLILYAKALDDQGRRGEAMAILARLGRRRAPQSW
jgi:tetratricopeptide (TPR) repeat protein